MIREALDREASQNNPVDLENPASSSGKITGGPCPFVELGITQFTPSEQHTVACLDTIIFYKSRNIVVNIQLNIINYN